MRFLSFAVFWLGGFLESFLCRNVFECRRGSGGGCTHVMHGRSRMTIDPRIPFCRDGARRVFTDQEDIVCTKREAP